MWTKAAARITGRVAACAILGLLLSAPVADAMAPASGNTEVSRQTVGAWTVTRWAKPDQMGFCSAGRTGQDNVRFAFSQDKDAYTLVIVSPAWDFVPQSTFPVSLAAGQAINGDSRAIAVAKNIVVIPLGNIRQTIGRLDGERALNVKTATATITLPLDQFAGARAALEACIVATGTAATTGSAATPGVTSAISANAFAPRPSDATAPAASAIPAPAPGLTEEPTFLTVRSGQSSYRLEALIVRPARAQGRLPVALITHGKNPVTELPFIRSELMLPQARDLAYRGWLAVVVVRRGYGRSDGLVGANTAADAFATCQNPDFRRAFDAEADDLDGALRVVAERPDADASRVIALGNSVGGGAVLAFAARQPKGLVAAINISGGAQFTADKIGRCGGDEALLKAMTAFGASTRVPTFWVYAQNDSLFGPDLVRRMRDAFASAGGKVDLHQLGALTVDGRPVDGHALFSTLSGRAQWLAELDRFLRARALPTWRPADVTAALRAARGTETARPFIEQHFSNVTPKVLVLAPSAGRLHSAANTAGLAAARSAALADCQQKSGEKCVVLMENFALLAPFAKAATPPGVVRR